MDADAILIDAFTRIPTEVESATVGLSADGLAFRPDPAANSIGWLVWHLTRVQDHHVSELAGRRQLYTSEGWANRLGMEPDPADIGFGHSADQVAAVRFDEPGPVVAYLGAVTERTLEYVSSIDAAGLDRIVDRRWDPPVSAGVRLVSVIGDCMQHAGQARYVRGIYDRQSGGSAPG
ncbi:MAG: DinB family protein [Acidimicrobiia bacterium]|nr:DinB family protein [Acidimicrobiia bacterium]